LYEVERSADAQNFVTIGSAKANNNPSIAAAYNCFDVKPFTGDNYYRIKTVEKSGEVKESEIVRVNIAGEKNTISVINNPVHGNSIQLLFNNAEKGNYLVNLVSQAGEKVFVGSIVYTGGTSYQELNLQSYLAKGIYQLQLINGATIKSIQVLVQ